MIYIDWYEVRSFFRKAWLVVKHRPFFTCPFCRGDGGRMGYTDCGNEWSECSCCYDHWDDLSDHGLTWFEGRIPLWELVRSKVSIWCGLWYPLRLCTLFRCKVLRWHRWVDEPDHGVRICACCWHHVSATSVGIAETGDE